MKDNLYRPRTDDHVVFHADRTRMLLYAVGAAAVAAAGAWLWAVDALAARVAGFLVAFLFGGFAVVALALAVAQRSRLVISAAGIEVPSWGIEAIPWSSVRSVVIVQVRRQRFLALRLEEGALDRSRFGLIRRLLLDADRSVTQADLSLPCHGLNEPMEAVLETIQTYRRRYAPETLTDQRGGEDADPPSSTNASQASS